MGIITMVIFLTTLTLLAGWTYLGITQHSLLDILIPGGLGAGTALILLAEIEESPFEFVMAVAMMVMGLLIAIPIANAVHPFIVV